MMYDLNGNLVQTIDRRNLSTTLAYNLSDMLVSKTTVDAVRGNTVVATTYTQFGPARVLKSEGAAAIVQNDFWYHLSGGILKQQQTIDGHTVEINIPLPPRSRDAIDPETGQRYTVKRHASGNAADGDSWRHRCRTQTDQYGLRSF